MTSIAHSPVSIQTSEHSAPLPPPWFGEVVLIAAHLRTLFLDDLLARPLGPERQRGELVDREAQPRLVFDIDGTREAARQRALPKNPDLPSALRRLDEVCAPGYTGRKRGEVVRTRTAV